MIMLKLFSRAAVLGLLFAFTFPVQADEIQDANKLFKQGQHAQAMEKVNAYLAVKPKDAQARFLKGLILAEQNNIPEAIAIFTGLTEDYPELPEPYNNLAVLYAQKGQYESARVALESAVKAAPDWGVAHENLGDIYVRLGAAEYATATKLDKANKMAAGKLVLARDLLAPPAKKN